MLAHLEALDETDIEEFCAVEWKLRLSNALALLNNDEGIAKILSLKKWVHKTKKNVLQRMNSITRLNIKLRSHS